MRRLLRPLCVVVGHRMGDVARIMTGSFTGYSEQRYCQRCGASEWTQIPQ